MDKLRSILVIVDPGAVGHPCVAKAARLARSRLFEFLIGSSAERVLDRLDCDILVLKPEGLSATMWNPR